jgi:cellulose synthase/poly-beta-1,6-N-acetylglucosamine synthase-like glycosyltransferase
VVVSARNEEQTIEECVRGILNQLYPADLYEIIVVNDCSTDQTEAILARIAATHEHVRTLSVRGDGGQGSAGKPAAISAGVKAAKGEIVLTTDADCSVPPTWIVTMVRYLLPGVAFAAGPVRERSDGTFLSNLSRLEFLGLITTAAGLIGAQRPIICNGANLAYRKSAFLEAQGYGNTNQWCDDETLMHRIRERHLGGIVFVPTSDAEVETASVRSIASFWKQRLRWSTKENHYENISVLLYVIGLYFFFLFLLIAFVGSIFYTQLRFWFVVSFGIKVLIDHSTLIKGAKLFRDSFSMFLFFIAETLHVPYVVVTAGFGQFITFDWKGRTISK